MSRANSKIWFITGSSSGFGRILAEAVLQRGERAVLTARNPSSVADLVERYPGQVSAQALDVTHTQSIHDAVAAANEVFGGIDVLVNNAGYGLIGAVEEVDPAEYRPLFETNVFGLIEVTRAVLPTMRRRARGRIVQISSNLGVASRAGYGFYSASKFAVEGLSEALAAEVEPFGISVIIVEPGAFRTGFLNAMMQARVRDPAYEDITGKIRDAAMARIGKQPGNPIRAIAVLLDAVDSEAPPLRLPLGPDAFKNIRAKVSGVLSNLDAWEPVASKTDY